MLIDALDQYVENQEDWLEGEEKPDQVQVEKLRVAKLILAKLQKDLIEAVGA